MITVHIGVWDNDTARIQRTCATLDVVMRKMKLPGQVTVNCEPPQLSRQNLGNRYPSLEICNEFWCRKPGEDLTVEQLEELFTMMLATGRIMI